MIERCLGMASPSQSQSISKNKTGRYFLCSTLSLYYLNKRKMKSSEKRGNPISKHFIFSWYCSGYANKNKV